MRPHCPSPTGSWLTNGDSSIAIDHLRKFHSDQLNQEIGVVSIFSNYKEQALQTTVNLIASIWMQLVQRNATVNENVKKLHRNHIDRDTRPGLQEILEVLRKDMARYKKIYIVVDALDEISDDSTRETLLGKIRGFQPIINLMITSRFMESIARLFDGAPSLEISAIPADVRAYVTGRISKGGNLTRHVRRDPKLAGDIEDHVAKNSQKMY